MKIPMPIYLIGSLRNPLVPALAQRLRQETGADVFDDWHAAGPTADDEWHRYEQERGHTYRKALQGFAARHTFTYDWAHLQRAQLGVLMLPAGKSGHLELGYLIGRNKPCYILLEKEEPERWDVMYGFAKAVCGTPEELIEYIKTERSTWSGTGT